MDAPRTRPQRLKPRRSEHFVARLKPCPSRLCLMQSFAKGYEAGILAAPYKPASLPNRACVMIVFFRV
jgi:hypothetical protein